MLACSNWMIGTLDASYCRISGGIVPGGMRRRMVCEMAVDCATALAMSTPGWKKILMIAAPLTVCDSIDLTSLTAEETVNSLNVVMYFSNCAGGRPLYCQMMLTTGMLIFGKMSVAIFLMATMPRIRMSSAITMKV